MKRSTATPEAPAPTPSLAAEYLNVGQAAARLGMCQITFRKNVMPFLPVVKLTRRVVISSDHLAAFMKSREKVAAEGAGK